MYPLIKIVRKKIASTATLAIVVFGSLVLVACGNGQEDDPMTTGGNTAGDTGGASDAGTDSSDVGGSDAGTTAGTTGGSNTSGSTDTGTPPDLSHLPIVRVPSDILTVVSEEVPIVGSAIFPGIPLDIPVIDWSAVSGPGTVSFSKSASLATYID